MPEREPELYAELKWLSFLCHLQLAVLLLTLISLAISRVRAGEYAFR